MGEPCFKFCQTKGSLAGVGQEEGVTLWGGGEEGVNETNQEEENQEREEGGDSRRRTWMWKHLPQRPVSLGFSFLPPHTVE